MNNDIVTGSTKRKKDRPEKGDAVGLPAKAIYRGST
jgi:hypothetical protein